MDLRSNGLTELRSHGSSSIAAELRKNGTTVARN